jgi:hypothetical protein
MFLMFWIGLYMSFHDKKLYDATNLKNPKDKITIEDEL